MSLETLRREAHDRACRARAVARVAESDEFAAAYGRACEDARAVAIRMIRDLDKGGLDAWVAVQLPEKDYSDQTLRELRAVGQKLGIRGYHVLPKSILLSEIAHAEKSIGPTVQEAARRDAAEPARGRRREP